MGFSEFRIRRVEVGQKGHSFNYTLYTYMVVIKVFLFNHVNWKGKGKDVRSSFGLQFFANGWNRFLFALNRSIEPWLKTGHQLEDGREYRQTTAERKRLDGLYECILCACCSSSCPSYWWNPEEFLGPAPLLRAYRWICDR